MAVLKTKLPTVLLAAFVIFACVGCPPGPTAGIGSSGIDVGDADYTIRLNTEAGEYRTERIRLYQESYCKHMGWDNSDLFVVRISDDITSLYYKRFDTYQEAEAKLKELKVKRSSNGHAPFKNAKVFPLPGQSFGPDKWNLAKVKGYYTVCVGRWFNDTKVKFYNREEFAVAHCKELRGEGYDAYFYHGPAESLVTVGIFGENAVRKESTFDKDHGKREVTKIVSPRARAILAMKKFARMAVNGRERCVTVPIGSDPSKPLPEGVEFRKITEGEHKGAKKPVRWDKSHMVCMPNRPEKEAPQKPADRKPDQKLPNPWI